MNSYKTFVKRAVEQEVIMPGHSRPGRGLKGEKKTEKEILLFKSS